jgi:hypothetical protein
MKKEIIKIILEEWEEYKSQDGVYSDGYNFLDFMEFLEKNNK